jgi:hypothetical protein
MLRNTDSPCLQLGAVKARNWPWAQWRRFRFARPVDLRTMTGHFSLCGEGLCVGYDSSDPVSSEYGSKSQLTGGTIKKVVFDVADDAYVDVERHMQAALMRD